MDKIVDIIMTCSPETILTFTVSIVFILILFIINQFQLKSIKKKYTSLEEGTFGENIEDKLQALEDKNSKLQVDLDILNGELEKTKGILNFAFKKMSMIRYNAFEDIGSDQSFSIALLDSNNNGVILSGIYSREHSSTYAKPIKNGESEYFLTEEEERVLKDALSKEL